MSEQVKRLELVRTGGRVRLETRDDRGHLVVQDGKEDLGGSDAGMRPMELFLAALAGCMSMDIIHILGKMQHEPERFAMSIEGHRGEQVPMIYEHIHLRVDVEGDVQEKNLSRAAHLSHEKYCSVSMMLREEVRVTFELHLNGELVEDTRKTDAPPRGG